MRAMNRVLDHEWMPAIGSPLDLVALAERAHFSPYHFHRLFAAWTGKPWAPTRSGGAWAAGKA